MAKQPGSGLPKFNARINDVDPRVNTPSVHNGFYAALPLSQLLSFRRNARYNVGITDAPAKNHTLAMLKPFKRHTRK